MLRILTIFGAAFLASFFVRGPQRGSNPEAEYIDAQFQAAIGDVPALAWVLPDRSIAAQNRSPVIAIYSRAETLEEARFRVSLAPETIPSFVREHHVACDVPLEQQPALSLYDSSLKLDNPNPQVLSTSKALPGIKAGFRRAVLSEEAGREVWAKMQPESSQQPRSS